MLCIPSDIQSILQDPHRYNQLISHTLIQLNQNLLNISSDIPTFDSILTTTLPLAIPHSNFPE